MTDKTETDAIEKSAKAPAKESVEKSAKAPAKESVEKSAKAPAKEATHFHVRLANPKMSGYRVIGRALTEDGFVVEVAALSKSQLSTLKGDRCVVVEPIKD